MIIVGLVSIIPLCCCCGGGGRVKGSDGMISGDESVDMSASISTQFIADVDEGGASSYSQLFPDEERPLTGFRFRIPFRIVLLPPKIIA